MIKQCVGALFGHPRQSNENDNWHLRTAKGSPYEYAINYHYVRQAAAFKKSEEAVKAPDRVEAVIVKVRDKAEKYGASPEIAETVYRNMINGFINMEMTEYKN